MLDAAALADGPDPVATMLLADGTRRDVPRRSHAAHHDGTTGDLAAMPLYAGSASARHRRRRRGRAIVAELCQGLVA